MTEDEKQLVMFLHQHRGTFGPAQAIAYRALLGDAADSKPPAPRDVHDLYQCLDITGRIPAATEAVSDLGRIDPHWRAIERNWITLHQNLAHETGGNLRHPWAERTTHQLTQIAHLLAAGTDPENIELPLLSEDAPATRTP